MVRNDRPRLRAVAAALAASIAAGLTVGVTTVAPPASAMVMRSDRPSADSWVPRYNRRIVRIINNRRADHGLRRVARTSCATSWAYNWSSHLAREDRFEHSNLGRLLSKCRANYASENIALVYDGARPRDLVRAWMNSPGHRANILSNKAKLTGVSILWDSDQNAWVAVQNFVRQ